jgi:hypothetical protein
VGCLPAAEDVSPLAAKGLALVLPVVLAVLRLLDSRVRVCQFVADQSLLVFPVLVVQLLFAPRLARSVLGTAPEDGVELAVDGVLGVVGELLEVDALPPFAEGRSEDADVFFFVIGQRLQLAQLQRQLLQESRPEFAELDSVRMACDSFFHLYSKINRTMQFEGRPGFR